MGDAAYGNKIDAGFGVGANIFERDASRAFEGNAASVARADFDGLANVFDAGVVDEDGVSAVAEGLLQLFERTNFDFDGLMAAAIVEGAFEGGNGAAGEGDVIVLDEDAVGKIEAMILAAAATDGVLVEDAQAGRGLASIENTNARAGDGVDEFARDGGDAGHALEEIQNHALAGENDARVVANDRNLLAGIHTHAVED